MEQKQLKMEEVQRVSLEILKKITAICESQNLRYTLAYGTLIGAIRHKGFIPWDDDIDIQMPRPDYDCFIDYMIAHPIANLKVFNHRYVKGYPLGISRICDMRYKVIEKNISGLDMGIFVDVYPIDGLGNTYEGAKANYSITDIPRANLLRMNCTKELSHGLRYKLSGLKLKLFGGLPYVQRTLENKAKKYSFENSNYVGIPNWNWIKLVYKRDWYEDFIKWPFEDGTFYISKYYDDILRAEYGDYMQLPPVEKRVYHHGYKAYKR